MDELKQQIEQIRGCYAGERARIFERAILNMAEAVDHGATLSVEDITLFLRNADV